MKIIRDSVLTVLIIRDRKVNQGTKKVSVEPKGRHPLINLIDAIKTRKRGAWLLRINVAEI